MSGMKKIVPDDFLAQETEFYELHREEYERDHWGEFVLIYKSERVGFYTEMAEAIKAGIVRCGVEPVLIRKVGEKEVTLRSFSYNIR